MRGMDTFGILALVSLLLWALPPTPTCFSETVCKFKLPNLDCEALGCIEVPIEASDEPPYFLLGAPEMGLLGGLLPIMLTGAVIMCLDDILCFEKLLAVVGPPFLTEFHLALSISVIGRSSILTTAVVPLSINFLLNTSVSETSPSLPFLISIAALDLVVRVDLNPCISCY